RSCRNGWPPAAPALTGAGAPPRAARCGTSAGRAGAAAGGTPPGSGGDRIQIRPPHSPRTAGGAERRAHRRPADPTRQRSLVRPSALPALPNPVDPGQDRPLDAHQPLPAEQLSAGSPAAEEIGERFRGRTRDDPVLPDEAADIHHPAVDEQVDLIKAEPTPVE